MLSERGRIHTDAITGGGVRVVMQLQLKILISMLFRYFILFVKNNILFTLLTHDKIYNTTGDWQNQVIIHLNSYLISSIINK